MSTDWDKEVADAFVSSGRRELALGLIRRAIAEEREACAAIALEEVESCREASERAGRQGNEQLEDSFDAASSAAQSIDDRIRARGKP